MRFSLFGTKIYVSFLFAATVSFMLATDRTGLVIPTLFAVLIHEVGHLFTMYVSDSAPKEIRLIPASVQIIEDYRRPQKSRAVISLSGPLANVAVGSAIYINACFTGSQTAMKFAIINGVVAAFNMLPVSGLDGGRLLLIFLCRKRELYSSMRILSIVTAVLAAAVFLSGVYLIVSGNANLSVFIVALYLAVCAILKR
ncbi:MAG: site-2 protease family protein [Clostridia bacterium]|nr:site-2 protease family protein [Clostridia bacterium]